jgi:protein-S-isoprenylcysteine O-methyltransferase Ste14
LLSKLFIFIFGTAICVYVSRASFLYPNSHGFYRFFAWEAMLILMLINLDGWFHDPFSWHQIISWFLLSVSAFLAIYALQLFIRIGKQDSRRNDAPMIEFEKTTTLVTVGVYHYIRHPMYSSLLFLAWGVFFKSPSWLAGILALMASCFLIATAKTEETEDIRFFGASYLAYMKQTKMFIPFLF